MFVKLKHDIVGYKKVYSNPWNRTEPRIVTLIIPAGTWIYYNAYEEKNADYDLVKFRAAKAYVAKGEGYSGYDRFFRYTPGKIVEPKNPFSKSYDSCANGIHFYISRQEALWH